MIEFLSGVTKFLFGVLGGWILFGASLIVNIWLWSRIKKLDSEIDELCFYILLFENSLKGTKNESSG